ncbi:hypothetical protein ACTMSW_24010 [Micromonospora sp. BQ11]|uniref:hypothetical protein n=1 Tax=Micromonospora sp. BQ11 TaxID=3452212 RepID=UPI003F893C33
MTTGQFREVDHDLLADYVGGALDGTPEEATVARLVDEVPAWTDAYALLAPAVADVRDDLAAWGAVPVAMPPDVTDRISAVLVHADAEDAASDVAGPVDATTGAPDPVGRHIGGRAGNAVPAQPLGGRRPAVVSGPAPDRGAATGPGRRQRRWTRVAGPIALAAASLAVVGLGLQQVAGRGGGDTATSELAHPEVATPAAGSAFRTVEPPQRSGVEYTAEVLASRPSMPSRALASGVPGVRPGQQDDEGRVAGPASLDRLNDPAALDACLAAITAEHGSAPLVVDVIDYARFQGESALIVRFTDATGTRWSWVTGAECGVPGSGSDARFRTRVG